MATTNLVIFCGELHTVVGAAMAQTFDNDGNSIITPIIAVTRVEPGLTKEISRVTWITEKEIFTLTSAFDFQYSEWYKGLRNGNR